MFLLWWMVRRFARSIRRRFGVGACGCRLGGVVSLFLLPALFFAALRKCGLCKCGLTYHFADGIVGCERGLTNSSVRDCGRGCEVDLLVLLPGLFFAKLFARFSICGSVELVVVAVTVTVFWCWSLWNFGAGSGSGNRDQRHAGRTSHVRTCARVRHDFQTNMGL